MDTKHVVNIASQLGIEVSPNWTGVDAIWPLLEMMRAEGSIVILKLDGERTGLEDAGPYTVLASGAPLSGDTIRIDATTIEEAITYVICRYASKVWGVPLPT
jgi:hypothetical protein